MNDKSKHYIISLGTYPFDLLLSIGQTDSELSKVLQGLGVDADEDGWRYSGNDCAARACMFRGNQTVIRLRERPVTPHMRGILAHEIFHIATFVMHRIGVRFKVGVSDEAYSYLVQYITERVYENIK